MIVKDLEPLTTTDRLLQAGHAAEKQMAFYLKRAFGSDPAVHVFHNLRLEQGEDAAQIDHLILHRSGAVIVESKSVTSAVRINERDEWARQWNGRWTGMPSPVLQAKRQADFLGRYLSKHREELLGRFMFGMLQKDFGAFIIDVVVAISDQGVVQSKGRLDEVRKADQVPDFIRERLQEHKRLASLVGLVSLDKRARNEGITLTPEEFARVSAFLRARHKPRGEAEPIMGREEPRAERSSPPASTVPPTRAVDASPAPPALTPTPASGSFSAESTAFTCRHCQSANLEVAYGKFGYYFKCRNCDGNTPIHLTCPSCGGKQKTRKAGSDFYAECSACGTSRPYYRNPT